MSDFKKIERIFGKSVTVKKGWHFDNHITIDGWITLTPVEVDEKIETILGTTTRKVTKWNIDREIVTPAKRYADGSGEPEDIEIEEVESGLSLIQACKSVWHMIKDNEVDGMFENFDYEEEAYEEHLNDKIEG